MVQENSNESNEDHAMDYDADESAQIQKKIEKKGKNVKRGIIYLSTIPKYMNITMIREIFSAYGKVGRVYLQLVDNETQSVKHKKKTKKVIKHFTEGWIEFESKKVAKFVAETLNNTQVSTRKKSKFYDVMWNIKYLPRFKWIHLSERLAYERAVHKQRLLTEIAQAKREINFFSYNVDRSKKLRRKHEQGEETTFELPEVKQRDTDNEIRNRKANTQVEDRTEFLKSIFG
ncbi:PREDICTED: activator of basal transcription 1-like [Acromyrmex echinatior]|uniref:Activator of basal transcription 1 n=2 Tax=Acromyrmex TaxID=64782 RepID=F4WC48_ACREC|nr:PREDICTED: activator of basal transcription 1-like [Acromyrmex echinatior]EGI68028.1 Pre-rRNA-processing protein esf2 [Acromyrmex echinatior]